MPATMERKQRDRITEKEERMFEEVSEIARKRGWTGDDIDQFFLSMAARIRSAMRRNPGAPRKIRACKWGCGFESGAFEMQQHERGKCELRPAALAADDDDDTPRGRPIVERECPKCGRKFGTAELIIHRGQCDGR